MVHADISPRYLHFCFQSWRRECRPRVPFPAVRAKGQSAVAPIGNRRGRGGFEWLDRHWIANPRYSPTASRRYALKGKRGRGPRLLHSRKSAIGLSVLIRGRLKRKGVWQKDKGHPELNARSRFHFSATIFLPKRLLRTGNYGKKIVGRKMKTQTWAYLRGFLRP